MAKYWKRTAIVVASAVLSATLIFGAACGNNEDTPNPAEDGKTSFVVGDPEAVTYRTYTPVMPSNWNELTYEDNNDTQILNYLVSSFFEYDYEFDEAKGGKFNEDGTINVDAIVPDGFSVKYSAATKLEDVTADVDAKWGYTDAQKEAGAYAWKITLRNDLKWDDGTPIKASDFVYTMQQQLDPLFFNMRANTYYNNTPIKNARTYLYQQGPIYNDLVTMDGENPVHVDAEPTQKDDGTLSIMLNGESVDLYASFSTGISFFFGDASMGTYYKAGYNSYFYKPYEGDTSNPDELPEYVVEVKGKNKGDPSKFYEDLYLKWSKQESERGYVAVTSELLEDLKVIAQSFGDPNPVAWQELVFYFAGISDSFDWENVGIYAPSDYEIVVCLDAPIQMLKEDGNLSYLAAYNFSSLPLVKKSLYESCKKEPQTGSTLWTTNYNSSLETSASWGPYKLTKFQSGKAYTLSRNDNWYGYDLEDNEKQYNIDAVYCEVISDVNTQWMSFLGGYIDDIGLDVAHKDDYRNSKYTSYAPDTGTFGIQLFSGLDVLKTNGHNAGVLAIKDFRQAISLFLDRDDYNQTIYTSHRSCYGLLGPSYYYDVENGGVYRDTQQAKETLLSVYGFTKGTDGKWTDGTNTYTDYEEAYEAMNGMNRPLAKELLGKAWIELTTNAEKYGYDSSKKITLTYGSSADNENTRRGYDYMVRFFNDLTSGTPFEGKIELVFDASAGSGWADAFKNGEVELAAGTGFSGGAFDPEGFLQCYVDPEAGLMYSENFWDTDAEDFTFTMPAADVYGDFAEAGQTFTMSVLNWYCCLNGVAGTYGAAGGYNITQTFNWGAGAIPEGARMELLAALEKLVLEKYYTIITTSEYSASLLGAKFSQFSEDYNIFMGFGGFRYMVVNYNDGAWQDFVAATNKGNLTDFYKAEA